MADKKRGGTRNYMPGSRAYHKRREEYEQLISSGKYDPGESRFYQGGGFVVVSPEHNPDKEGDKSTTTARALAKHGYRVYLESEKSVAFKESKRDGRIETHKMDIKTLNTPGKSTLKAAMALAATKQNSTAVVVRQNNNLMTREYVEQQIELFKDEASVKARERLEWLIVVSRDGKRVHRHKLK